MSAAVRRWSVAFLQILRGLGKMAVGLTLICAAPVLRWCARRGLILFCRPQASAHTTILAQWRSPHALEWSWFLAFTRFGPETVAPRWGMGRHRDHNGLLQWMVMFGVGALDWHRQRPVYFKDVVERTFAENSELRQQIAALAAAQEPKGPGLSHRCPTVSRKYH